ncbi:hypothetical protein GGR54DRAFT_622314, partial [Hypoxylon sp. NC1633]
MELDKAGFGDVVVEEVQMFYEFENPEAMTWFNNANTPAVYAATADLKQDEVEKAIQLMF